MLGVAGVRVVVLGVAVPVERAGRVVVADRPVLVVERARRRDGHRVAPRLGVGRPAQLHVHDARGLDAQPGDHPDVVLGVIGDRGVADLTVRAAGVGGRRRQETVRPGLPAVGRRGPADVRGAAAGDAAHLERRHHRVAEAEGVRFHLGRVLGLAVGIGVAADLSQRDRRVGGRRRSGQRRRDRGRGGQQGQDSSGHRSGHGSPVGLEQGWHERRGQERNSGMIRAPRESHQRRPSGASRSQLPVRRGHYPETSSRPIVAAPRRGRRSGDRGGWWCGDRGGRGAAVARPVACLAIFGRDSAGLADPAGGMRPRPFGCPLPMRESSGWVAWILGGASPAAA